MSDRMENQKIDKKLLNKNDNNDQPSLTPQPRFSVITKEGLKTYFGPLEFVEKDSIQEVGKEDPLFSDPTAKLACWNRDGSVIAIAGHDKITLKTEAGQEIKTFQVVDTSDLQFSPKGSYLMVLTRVVPQKNNFFVFGVGSDSTEPIQSARVQNLYFRNETMFTCWSEDETIYAKSVKSEIHFFEKQDFEKWSEQYVNTQLLNFSISPSTTGRCIAVALSPKSKESRPGGIALLSYPGLQEISRRSFFGIDEVYFYWNADGTYLAAVAKASMDKQNKNYNEESHLYFFSSDGKIADQVKLKKEGPIHDLAWNPTGDQLAVVYGAVPPFSTIFNTKLEQVVSLGTDWRNTLKWAPNGKALLLGGFGALPGDMDFWEPKKIKKLATTKAPTSSVQLWSPDSRHLLSGILYQRMKVDNSVRIFKYDGTLAFCLPNLNELTQVFWKPISPTLFASKNYFVPKQLETSAPAPVSKYVPPHKRNPQSSGPVGSTPAIFTPSSQPQRVAPSHHAPPYFPTKSSGIVGDTGSMTGKPKKKKKPRKQHDQNKD